MLNAGVRSTSGRVRASILTTSAPSWASMRPAVFPATNAPKLRTRTPASGPVDSDKAVLPPRIELGGRVAELVEVHRVVVLAEGRCRPAELQQGGRGVERAPRQPHLAHPGD